MSTVMYDQAEAPLRDGAIANLDQQLDRLDNSIERLARILMPVMRSEATDDRIRPVDVSATQLHERVTRLSDRLDNLDRLMNSVAL